MAHGWSRRTTDGIVTESPAILYAVMGYRATAGVIADVYDGQDADSGRKLMTLSGLAYGTSLVLFGRDGIFMPRGIYVDMQTGGVEVTLVYDAL